VARSGPERLAGEPVPRLGRSWQVWLVSFLLSGLVLTLVLLFLNRRFDYLDDVGILEYARSGVAILYASTLIGDLLSFLYTRVSSTVPWYGILLYAVQFLAMAVCIRFILARHLPRGYKVAFSTVLLAMYVPFLMRASYNYASILPGGLSFIGLFSTLEVLAGRGQRAVPGGEGEPSALTSSSAGLQNGMTADEALPRPYLLWLRSLLWGLLLALSFLFRRDGSIAAWLFVGVPLVAFLLLLLLNRRTGFRYGLFAAACLGAFILPYVLIQMADGHHYRHALSPEEQAHRAANEARGDYFAYGLYAPVSNNPELLKANGWTENDAVLIEYAMGPLEEIKFSAERYETIFDRHVGLSLEESRRSLFYNLLHFGRFEGFRWFNPRESDWKETWEYWPYYLVMVTLALLAVWRGRTWYYKLFPVALLGYIYLASLYLLNYKRLPRHVAVPPLVLYCVVVFVCVQVDLWRAARAGSGPSPRLSLLAKARGWDWGTTSRLGILPVLLFLTASLAGFSYNIARMNAEIPVRRSQLNAFYADLRSRVGDDAFVFIRPQLYLEYYIDPLSERGPEVHTAALGVSSGAYSPLFYRLLGDYGLSYGYQVLPWMVDNPKAYFVSSADWLMESVREFFFENYGMAVEVEPVYRYPGDSMLRAPTVYRFKTVVPRLPHFRADYDLVDSLDQATVTAPDLAYVRPSRFVIGGQSRKVLFQHPPSQVSYQIQVPQAAYLAFSTAMSSEVWEPATRAGDGVRFGLTVDDGSGVTDLISEYIDPKRFPADRIWHEHQIDLSPWAGRLVTLTFVTDPGPGGDARDDWAGWGQPEIGRWAVYDFVQRFFEAEPPPARLDQTRVVRTRLGESWRDVIFQHPTGALTFPVRVEPFSRLEFGIGLDPAVWSPEKGDGVRFEIWVTTAVGAEQLYSRYVDPKNEPDDRGVLYESLELDRFAGQEVRITFSTYPGPQDDARFDWALWVAPVLITTVPG